MKYTFYDAQVFSADISGWDTSSVQSMSGMFRQAYAFDGDIISGWDTSSVGDMSSMFQSATSFNGTISGWNTSSVKGMGSMFYSATSFDGDLSGWDTSSVEDMSSMFQSATSFDRDISGWDVGSVTNTASMFDGADSLSNCSKAAIDATFSELGGWTHGSEDWDTLCQRPPPSPPPQSPPPPSPPPPFQFTTRDELVQAVNEYLSSDSADAAEATYGNISTWDTSSVEDMSELFSGQTDFDGDLSGWDTSSVTDMSVRAIASIQHTYTPHPAAS